MKYNPDYKRDELAQNIRRLKNARIDRVKAARVHGDADEDTLYPRQSLLAKRRAKTIDPQAVLKVVSAIGKTLIDCEHQAKSAAYELRNMSNLAAATSSISDLERQAYEDSEEALEAIVSYIVYAYDLSQIVSRIMLDAGGLPQTGAAVVEQDDVEVY